MLTNFTRIIGGDDLETEQMDFVQKTRVQTPVSTSEVF